MKETKPEGKSRLFGGDWVVMFFLTKDFDFDGDYAACDEAEFFRSADAHIDDASLDVWATVVDPDDL